jgi:quercetin dioxygenase-like cupin family protein
LTGAPALRLAVWQAGPRREEWRVGEIFQVNEHDVPWMDYEEAVDEHGRPQIRVKPLTLNQTGVPPVQYVEYRPGHTDPVHSHKKDEFFIVVEGSIWLDDVENGAGSIVFIPRLTEYAVRAGDAGSRYFRVVVP